ncbi:MAG: methyltransferase [Micropruina sp.]|nr:methyltransferase [Micropruina sp.]
MGAHYFTTPRGPERRRTLKVHFWDTDWEFVGAAGVFSGSSLDQGTAVLLRESTPPAQATRLLDLGCGYGVIAVGLAVACPGAVVDAVDVNDRALTLTAENAATNGVGDRVRPVRPEQVEPTLLYDEIWSNPPIRIGKEALHELLLTWLPRLRPGGVARLVVSRNLGADSLQRWLTEVGYRCERLASAKGFRVFAVSAS